MCACLCAVNILQWRLNAGCIFCFKVNFIAPLPVRHPWQPCAPSSPFLPPPTLFQNKRNMSAGKVSFFGNFSSPSLLCSCFHLNFTLIGCNVFVLEAIQYICFALIMPGTKHLICCLFCCSTLASLAVINLCPLLLFFFFLYIYICSTHLHTHLYLLFIINVYSIYCLTRRHVYILNLCIILLNCVIEWGWLRINHSTLIAAANWVNNNYNTATTITITVLVTRLAHSLTRLTPLSYTLTDTFWHWFA